MNLAFTRSLAGLLILLVFCTKQADGQFLMDMMDTTKDVGKGMLGLYKKFDRIRISGYLQPQFQVTSAKGARSYGGGDFAPQSNSRFMLRRGRLRFDYVHFGEDREATVNFVFQFDGTERGVFIRDFWGRVTDNRWNLMALTAGMFARPFGFEVNLSSSDRETPERGRMSQILMRTERDMGAMLTLEPRRKDHPLQMLKWDIGIFNGQGLTGANEFDSYKDLITRLSLKRRKLGRNSQFSMGLSWLNGGLVRNSRYAFSMGTVGGNKDFVNDSSTLNIGAKAPRRYYGVDAQWEWKHSYGNTIFRAEYWQGRQSATAASSETPGTLPLEGSLPAPLYTRPFNGAFFYILQNLVSTKHQLMLKYDWYDPNTRVSGTEIGKANTSLGAADIKYSTLGLGYIYYMGENLKLVTYYEWIRNESTQLADFTGDQRDNLFTCRIQFRF